MLHVHSQPHGSAPKTQANGLRRPTRDGTLFGAALRCQVDLLVEKLGLSVAELVENACVHLSQEHLPLDDLASPYDAAQDYIDAALEMGGAEGGGAPLAAELRTPERALAAARELFAQRLFVDPELRRKARAHFGSAASLRFACTFKAR